MEENKIRMTEGSIFKTLIRFAFPLFLGGLFQQLYNAVDAHVVGKFCGDSALAAVTSAGSLCFLLIGFFQGVFIGGSVIISNRFGAMDKEGTEKAVHTIVVFALIAGAIISVAGTALTPSILKLMGTPENVMPDSVMYFRIYCIGLPALVLYNTANGIYQAFGDTARPLRYLIIASLTNVVLDYLFVGGFGMGVAGAALATALGQLLSAVLAFAHLMSGKFVVKVQIKKLRPDKQIFLKTLRLGIPSGVQNSVIAIANVVVQSNINAFGDIAMAGCGSYAKVEGFVFLPIMSLTMAMTTFISQNLGANQIQRAKRGAKAGVIMTSVFAELIGIAFFIFAPSLIAIFSDTPEVLEFGIRQARVESLFYFALGFSHACASVLRGCGRSITPMAVMLSVWCVFRILYITVGVKIFPNIAVVFSAYPVTWGISSVLFLGLLLHKGVEAGKNLSESAKDEFAKN